MKLIKLTASVLLLALGFTFQAGAQTYSRTERRLQKYVEQPPIKEIRVDSTLLILNQMTVEDYNALEIPPLDTLFKNAYMMSQHMREKDANIEYFQRTAKTVRRSPLDWIRLIASYSYGNSDLAAIALMETTYQVWTQSQSSQRNVFYNVGAAITIPLGSLFDHSNRVKQAQARVRQVELEKELEFETIKREIIGCCLNINKYINILNSSFKSLMLASGQYVVTENDFLNGKTDATNLYRTHQYEFTAISEYENLRKELNAAILTLEIISCTKIVSK